MNAPVKLSEEIISSLVINGDLSRLEPVQKVAFYNYRCQQAGLDPAAKPFDLLRLNGKEILYANATATQQLCANRKLSVTIIGRERVDDTYIVHARVTDSEGRTTDNMGAVPLAGLKGDGLSNAMMKATTKAIRRTVLAHCGLGMLDETEAQTIPGAESISLNTTVSTVKMARPSIPTEIPPIEEQPAAMSFDEAVTALIDYGSTEGFKAQLERLCAKIDRREIENFKKRAREVFMTIREQERAAGTVPTPGASNE